MGRSARYAEADFLRAARSLAAEHGAAGVTVATVTARLKAPTGSFYHRFDGRDALLAELWLATASDFQRGFIALADLGDGERAALHTVDWSRGNPEAAAILLLRHPADFLLPEAPAAAREAARAQARQIEACLGGFARRQLGSGAAAATLRARFLLLDLPAAVVRPHLLRRERVPESADHLVRQAYAALLLASTTPAPRRR